VNLGFRSTQRQHHGRFLNPNNANAELDLHQRKRLPLAALCLAASWLKYTISFPLSLVFIRQEWRTTFAIASTVHVGLTLFLAFWTGENPLDLLLGRLMLAGNAVTQACLM
jgi:hypothetical protein